MLYVLSTISALSLASCEIAGNRFVYDKNRLFEHSCKLRIRRRDEPEIKVCSGVPVALADEHAIFASMRCFVAANPDGTDRTKNVKLIPARDHMWSFDGSISASCAQREIGDFDENERQVRIESSPEVRTVSIDITAANDIEPLIVDMWKDEPKEDVRGVSEKVIITFPNESVHLVRVFHRLYGTVKKSFRNGDHCVLIGWGDAHVTKKNMVGHTYHVVPRTRCKVDEEQKFLPNACLIGDASKTYRPRPEDIGAPIFCRRIVRVDRTCDDAECESDQDTFELTLCGCLSWSAVSGDKVLIGATTLVI